MDTDLLVECQIEDGERMIRTLLADGIEVTVAFWIKLNENDEWRFNIATPLIIPGKGFRDAYDQVFSSLAKGPDLSVGLSDISLIDPNHPIAQHLLDIRKRHPLQRKPVRLVGRRLGGVAFEEAYLYPEIKGIMNREDLLQAILGLMNQPAPLSPSTFTLQDGSTRQAVPLGIQRHPFGGMEVTLLDAGTNQEEVLSLDDISDIR